MSAVAELLVSSVLQVKKLAIQWRRPHVDDDTQMLVISWTETRTQHTSLHSTCQVSNVDCTEAWSVADTRHLRRHLQQTCDVYDPISSLLFGNIRCIVTVTVHSDAFQSVSRSINQSKQIYIAP